ncbi:MAG: radical SAM protein [Gemmataceae bacterium]
MRLRDHTFLGMTQSLCPECLTLLPAKIIEKNGRVYFRKQCPAHGVREDFVCSDVRWYDRMEFSLPGKVPEEFGTLPDRGCPYDCGLCTEHEQHTCVGLVEITSSCNLQCPMCYASSGPGGKHLPFEECRAAIDRVVQVEGRAEVVQLSGGEPTTHPEFLRLLDYATSQAVDIVMINTNGLRFAHDPALVEAVARHRKRVEVYLQFDGFNDDGCEILRGERLVETKLKAVEALGRHGLRTILVTTLHPGVNDGDIGAIVKFGLERRFITGVSFQPATYSGRHVLPEDLERRITFPDVIRAVCEQTDVFREDDFLPLPCAHPNCHSLSYAYRGAGEVVPLARFIHARQHLDILANGITFTRARTRELIEKYLGKLGCCAGGECGSSDKQSSGLHPRRADPDRRDEPGGSVASEFFSRALTEQLDPEDVFRITITSFLDAYNFDVRRLMKCCIHHVLPSGHVVPFCAYNVLYREGHVALPALQRVSTAPKARPLPLVSLTGGA